MWSKANKVVKEEWGITTSTSWLRARRKILSRTTWNRFSKALALALPHILVRTVTGKHREPGFEIEPP